MSYQFRESAPYLFPPLARWLGSSRIDLEECGSTNDEAARMARGGASHGTIVIAETQRAGRGRDGRAWASPRGRGLYLSAVLRPLLPLADVPPMTLAIGIGVCDSIRATGAPAFLKWPNDVLVREGGELRKVAGVLVESQSQGGRLESVIVGIGANLGAFEAGELPPDVNARATSLEAAVGTPIDREAFIATLLAQVEHWVDHYSAVGLEDVVPAWTQRMAPGLLVRAIVDRAPVEGEMVGLAEDGAVMIRDAEGAIHRVRSGDVELERASSDARRPPSGAGEQSEQSG
ncbi:MAG TPA: biotin--[acetyl-CoA-carboxylase] ligase [Kofleriaceae bacterium]